MGYRLDFVVEEELIVEIKAAERLLPVHEAQLITYLRLAGVRGGLLVNFNTAVLRHGLRRLTLNPKSFPPSRLPVNPEAAQGATNGDASCASATNALGSRSSPSSGQLSACSRRLRRSLAGVIRNPRRDRPAEGHGHGTGRDARVPACARRGFAMLLGEARLRSSHYTPRSAPVPATAPPIAPRDLGASLWPVALPRDFRARPGPCPAISASERCDES